MEEKDCDHISQSAADIRDVFGESDEEEAAELPVQDDFEQDQHGVLDIEDEHVAKFWL